MSNNPERNKPEKSNPSQSKSRQGEDSKIRPNPNTLKFSDIPVNNEDSKSLETLFLPQQSSENFPRGFIGGKQSYYATTISRVIRKHSDKSSFLGNECKCTRSNE